MKPSVFAAVLVMAHVTTTEAALVVETRSNTSDIQVPRFNPALGTLQSVTLNVTMFPGSSTFAGGHDHGDLIVLSNNSVSSTSYFPFSPFSIPFSSFGGDHNHSFSTPSYGGGGVVIGSFTGTTSSTGSHDHSLNVTYGGFQQDGPNNYRLRALINPSTTSQTPSHFVSSSSKSLSFAGPGVAPFEGMSDIVIPAGSFTFVPDGVHNHTSPPFSRELEGTNDFIGDEVFTFSPSSLNFAGSHTQSFDPRFNVTATFQYAAIPEPSLAGVFLVGATAIACRRTRRRA